MNNSIEAAIKKIDSYLKSDFSSPFIVNLQSIIDKEDLITHYDVNPSIEFLTIDTFSKKEDELPPIELIFDKICNSKKITFITDLSSLLRLTYQKDITSRFNEILGLNIQKKSVIITLQCESFFNFQDVRLKQRIINVSDDKTRIPDVYFVNSEIKLGNTCSINGIRDLPHYLENQNKDIYVITQKNKSAFIDSTLNIKEIKSYFNLLSIREPEIYKLSENLGTQDQWKFLYKIIEDSESKTLSSVLENYFSDLKRLELIVNSKIIDKEDKNKRWLLFIALKLYGTPQNHYLDIVINNSSTIEELDKNMFRQILNISNDSKEFYELYKARKQLVRDFSDYSDLVNDYCQFVKIKEKNAIYYLTDNTQVEKETIIMLLDKYFDKYNIEELRAILKVVYYDLYLYLENSYVFNEKFLQNYFAEYKIQKVLNHINPTFIEKVNVQAQLREYKKWLQPRISLLESIDITNSEYYFVDALGVEFLSFILQKCTSQKLFASVKLCHSELPSITECNKDFVDYFNSKGLKKTDIKYLDEIKHQGKDDYDYNKTKLPYYLIRELEILDELIQKIKVKLTNTNTKKIILMSDHGASRLAVINDSNIIDIDESAKGFHGGRICDYVEGVPEVPYSIRVEDKLVLANYDRFRGSRAPSVETHGGATLEEVVIPIIEITLQENNIEITLMENEITVSFRKKAVIHIFSKTELTAMEVHVNGFVYKGIKNDNIFTFEMPEIRKVGNYSFDVYSENNLIKSGLSFSVKKESASENDLF